MFNNLLKQFFLYLPVNCDEMKVISRIQDNYNNALQAYIDLKVADQPNRFGEFILLLPQVQSAAALLLQNKMIWVPFLLKASST